jgi:hypothetical protein
MGWPASAPGGPVPCQRFFREQDGTAIVVVSAVEAMDAAIKAGRRVLPKPTTPPVSTVRDLPVQRPAH